MITSRIWITLKGIIKGLEGIECKNVESHKEKCQGWDNLMQVLFQNIDDVLKRRNLLDDIYQQNCVVDIVLKTQDTDNNVKAVESMVIVEENRSDKCDNLRA